MSLRKKTISGIYWSFIDSFTGQGIYFFSGVILARLLSPREFGLIGMITIFIAISQSFVDSGFGSALIRKKECTPEDYSTVFYFNLAASVLFFLLLLATAGLISEFYKEPQLKPLIQVLGFGLLLNAAGLIQRTRLTKEIDFKTQTKISIISSLGSGIIAIGAALKGYGVWSLVVLTLSRYGFNTALLWIWNRWIPLFIFSKNSFKELFSFGSKLLVSGLIDTVYKNIYYLIIGKYFSSVELGYYTRADQFKSLPSQQLTGIIERVSYPVLAGIQDDKTKLKTGYKKLLRSTMFIVFVAMLSLAAIAKPLIVVLIGLKWLPAAEYLQLLCFVGMMYPLHALNLNMLKVQGRSDLFLKLEIIKKLLAIPTIILGIIFGIKVMIVGMIINSLISYFLNSYWSGRFIDYAVREQIHDIIPSFVFALSIAVPVYLASRIFQGGYFLTLVAQFVIFLILVFTVGELLKIKDYLYLKHIVLKKS